MLRKVMISVKKLKAKHWLIIILISYILCDYFGLLLLVKQSSYDADFSYPYDGDVASLVAELKSGGKPKQKPVYEHDYFLYKSASDACLDEDGVRYEQLRVTFLVKSAVSHRDRRDVIICRAFEGPIFKQAQSCIESKQKEIYIFVKLRELVNMDRFIY